jgi:hypothetical protein
VSLDVLDASNVGMRHRASGALRKANPHSLRLIESYCEGCGLLIAASPRTQILAVIERLHTCPVYFRYPPRRAEATELSNLKLNNGA